MDRTLAHLARLRGTWLFGRLGRATDVELWGSGLTLASLSFHPPGRVDLFYADETAPRDTIAYEGGESIADQLARAFSDARLEALGAACRQLQGIVLRVGFVAPNVQGVTFYLDGLKFKPGTRPSDFVASLGAGALRAERGAAGEASGRP